MNGKFWRFAVALLPICFLSAQHPNPQAPRLPSPDALRRAAEQGQRMRARATAINELAGRIQSRDDARKLVDLVAAEFADELPPRWATRSIRNHIARAEFETAADPGSLIPEQRVADAWNDYLQKIGAPQDAYVTSAEIHVLRDSLYVDAQFFWARGNQSIWTVSNIYAVGPDGKVADGCRAIEVLNILWQLANQPRVLHGMRELIKKNQRLSDMIKEPSKPPSPESEKAYFTAQVIQMPPNPVEQAALHYMREHGMRALNGAIEGLLKDLFAS
jgi:hypothetical protein